MTDKTVIRRQISLYPEDVKYVLEVGKKTLHSKNFSATLRYIIRDHRKITGQSSTGESEK